MGQCQLLNRHGSAWHSILSWVNVNSSIDMGVPGIRLCHGSMLTPQYTWECLAFDSVMGQCQLLNRHGSAWHSILSWVNVNSSIDMGVPGIRLCHGSMSTPQYTWEYLAFDSVMGQCQLLNRHGSAWHSTLSWVNVNSSIDMGVPGIRFCHGSMSTPQYTWECLAFDSVMGQCQLLNRQGSAWHSTLSWVNVNSSIYMGVPGIRFCHGSMSTPPEHGSAWQLTWSWVNVNSSSIRECLVSMPTPSRGVETHCSVID